MNAIAEPVEHFRTLIDTLAPSLPGADVEWLALQRARATEHFVDQGFPSRRQEAWRYTSLERVLDQPWAPHARPALEPDASDVSERQLAPDAVARLVFLNGRWLPGFSHIDALAAGVQVGSLHETLQQHPERLETWLGQVARTEISGFTALNTALIDDGAWVQVAAGVRLSGPIELLYLSGGPDTTAAHTRNLVVIGQDAKATLVEHYASLDDAALFTNSLSEVVLGEGASLEHARLQDENAQARHISNIFVRQGESSHYHGVCVSLGGVWSRTEYHNRMQETGAGCELDGLYVAGDGQLNDVHLDIAHGVPACSSRERFKGIVLGRGRAVFDGRVRVDADAQKTDAHLANDNLLLSRNAEVDTKPQLEIFADDVKCSHGTTVGQLEPAQLFYLRSRGISDEVARRLLCLGFATEVLDSCPVDGLRSRVEQRLQKLLAKSPVIAPGIEE